MTIILAIIISVVLSVGISAIIAFEIMAAGYKQLIEQVMDLCEQNTERIGKTQEIVISTLEKFTKNKC